MSATPIILVHLRRPRTNKGESRADPFWEFGAFGCTGCHARNLLHPKRIEEVVGARLGFAQGGRDGFRLVHLTPPVRVLEHADRCEVSWAPGKMPFSYHAAPLLIRNDGATDFPLLKRALARVDRTTWEARFSSSFRTRRTPLLRAVGLQVAAVYDARRRAAKRGAVATAYWHALPWPPPTIDTARRRTYERLRSEIGAPVEPAVRVGCQSRRKRRC